MVIPKPDIIVRDITPQTEFLIIACDGIWDCLKSEEAVELVHNKIEAKAGAELKLTDLIGEIYE